MANGGRLIQLLVVCKQVLLTALVPWVQLRRERQRNEELKRQLEGAHEVLATAVAGSETVLDAYRSFRAR